MLIIWPGCENANMHICQSLIRYQEYNLAQGLDTVLVVCCHNNDEPLYPQFKAARLLTLLQEGTGHCTGLDGPDVPS